MRARRLVVVISLVATGGVLYACATTPGGPLAPLDRDDVDSATGSGGGNDGSVADGSTLADGPEDSAAADADAGAAVDAADAADAADAPDGD
jgi:hypothetical protein